MTKVMTGVHDESVVELAPVNGEEEVREVRLTEERGDDRREQVLDDGLDDRGEGRAENDRDPEVDGVGS